MAARATINFDNLRAGVPSLSEIFMAVGFFRAFFQWSVSQSLYAYWVCAGYVMFASILLAQIICRTGIKADRTYWLIVLIVFIPIATGMRGPFSPFIEWSYEHLAFMAGFRAQQKRIS